LGEGEALLQQTFLRARLCAPSIIFLDEIDSLFQNRADEGADENDSRLLSTLLTEMDGLQQVGGAMLDTSGAECRCKSCVASQF
jgi:SpoVK/Ycf46/Vps4 family AAA+-type ATPase